MKIIKSPTLSLSNKINFFHTKDIKFFSLSTPSFGKKNINIKINDYSSQKNLTGNIETKKIVYNHFFKKWKKIIKSPKNIIITSGAKSAIYCALRAILTNKNKVLIVCPAWPTYEQLIRFNNAIPVHYNTKFKEQFKININEIKRIYLRHKFKIIILSNPSNPTGRIYDKKILNDIYKFCFNNKIYFLLDESFSEVIFNHSNWKNNILKNNKYLILINSFSKNYHLQGLRLAACHTNLKLLEKIANIHTSINGAPSSIGQLIIEKNYKSIFNFANLKKQHRMVENFLIKNNIKFSKCEGTFYFFPFIENIEKLEKKLKKKNIFLIKGNVFGKSYKNHFRLCFSKPIKELSITLNQIK